MTNEENSPTSDEEQFGTSWSVYQSRGELCELMCVG